MDEDVAERVRAWSYELEVDAERWIECARHLQDDPGDTTHHLAELQVVRGQICRWCEYLDGLRMLMDGSWRDQKPPAARAARQAEDTEEPAAE